MIIIHSGLPNRVFGHIILECLDICQSSNCPKVLLTFHFSVDLMYAWHAASKTRIVGRFDAKSEVYAGRKTSKARIVGRFDAKPEINK